MAYFDTTTAENSQDQHVRETAKNHLARLAGAFRRVKEKLAFGKIAHHRPGILSKLSEMFHWES